MLTNSCYNLVKTRAKTLRRNEGLKLSTAQERIARESGFLHFHELQKVADQCPSSTSVVRLENVDTRFLTAAFGRSDLSEVIYQQSIYTALNTEIEEQLISRIADTNAYLFKIENFESSEVEYDPSIGVMSLSVSFEYQGE